MEVEECWWCWWCWWGPGGGSSGRESTGGALLGFVWHLRVPPGVTELGVHGLGQKFSHRHHWELPHPKGNGILPWDRHQDSTPRALAGQGGPPPVPLPQLCSLQFYFLRLFKIKASDGSGAPGSLSPGLGGGHTGGSWGSQSWPEPQERLCPPALGQGGSPGQCQLSGPVTSTSYPYQYQLPVPVTNTSTSYQCQY